MLAEVLDEQGMLSPHGIRSLSRHHLAEPFRVDVDGQDFAIGYEPAESTTGMYGGNSNWRGPVWMPVNYLVIEALERYGHYLGDTFTVEFPTGSGRQLTLSEVTAELRERLISIFLPGPDGRRPLFGGVGAVPDRPAVERRACCSPSTSTGTTAPGWAPPTRPAGPAWSPT